MANVYYQLDSLHAVSDYIKIGDALYAFGEACCTSEFQHLDRKPVTVEVADESGNVCQDFILENHVPLISERVKAIFDECGVDNLFYKKVVLTKEETGMKEIYWLALPPRIDCLNRRKSEFDGEDEIHSRASKIVISDRKVGNYKIFKLPNLRNDEIIITEDLAGALRGADLKGLYITEI